MLLSKRQRTQLEKIITQVDKILMQADAAEKRAAKSQRTVAPKKTKRKSVKNGARRRSHADAVAMRKEIKAARKKGISAATLAKKYGVSTSYIYQQR